MGDPQLLEILEFVAQQRGIDFRDYRRDTLRRRAETRVRATGCADLAAYRAYLHGARDEVDRLIETLVVPVTEFFRDERAFQQLAERVLPRLLGRNPVVQAWVVGTATGEEAYTLAILLAEASSRSDGAQFQVIASDVDDRSLEAARSGSYPRKAAARVPPELFDRYFRAEGSTVRVADTIRDRIRFARHDIVGHRLAPEEAVVASFDLVLCRNVLLYFDESLRTKALARLAAVLEPGGPLMIGPSESLPRGARSAFSDFPGVPTGCGIFIRRSD
jgi:two-component system, chemotaxis family, CheB/CheR fusion protein